MNKLSEIYIMVRENSIICACAKYEISSSDWLTQSIDFCQSICIVWGSSWWIFGVCVRIVTWWFTSSGLSQGFRNPKCLMIKDPRCMLVSEAHFSGWGCSRAGNGNHPSVGKGNDYMTRVLIIRSALLSVEHLFSLKIEKLNIEKFMK